MKQKLGEVLVNCDLITPIQLQECLQSQNGSRKRLGTIVVEKGYAKEIDIARVLASKLSLPFVELDSVEIDADAVTAVHEKLARKHQVFPIRIEGKGLRLAMADPLDIVAAEDIRFHSGYEVHPVVCLPQSIDTAINTHYNVAETLQNLIGDLPKDTVAVEVLSGVEQTPDENKLRRISEALPVVRIVNLLLAEAVRNKASDVHIEPAETQVLVRTRVDGILRARFALPKWVQAAVTSRIKIMALLDIAEKRLPQDGRVQLRIDGEHVDLRLSTIPTRHGEKLVIRVLQRESVPTLDKIGMCDDSLSQFRDLVNQPQGVILVTGPTGSGKTTTLYAALGQMKLRTLNIITLEDPIEYGIDDINQVQINEKAGLSFPVGLRSVLRQDPDVIYVGEMRDEVTASVALKASLTGHLVLSTLHTSTAASAVTRLVDMGIPPYLVGSALTAVLSQRLLRVVCEHCKAPHTPRKSDLAGLEMAIMQAGGSRTRQLKIVTNREREGSNPLRAWVESLLTFNRSADGPTFYRGEGCSQCSRTGYSGRTGVFELLRITPHIRELIYAGAPESQITRAAERAGTKSLLQQACAKLVAGETTIEEVIRVVATESGAKMLCRGCGSELETDYVSCPHCGLSSLPSCPSCGRRCETSWKFCAYCCKPLQAQAVNSAQVG